MSILLARHPLRRFVGPCLPAALWGILSLVTAGGAAFGQDDATRFADWGKVEAAAETRTFKEAMRSGGAFDGASRGYLEQVSLQLELEANRATIERVRKRMREFLLADIANEKAAEDANGVVLAAMQSLTERQDADAVVRVNAMLMIGELQGFDRKPFQAAAAVLARAAANDELPKSVRIAACVGLARHVEATKGLVEEQRRMAGIAQPAIVAILTETAAGASSVENDWLSSRCLTMLPLLGPATAETIAAAERIVRDGDRSINVRIRAAVALAAAAGSDSKLDAAAIIPAIGTLAVTSLERDVAIADRLVLERQAGSAAGLPGAIPPAAGPPGMPLDPAGQPAVEQLIPREVCRRAAWRLAVLADAILTDDSKRGLAVLAGGEIQPDFRELSQKLRRAAMELDAAPEEATLRQALVDLKPPAHEAGKEPEENPGESGTQ